MRNHKDSVKDHCHITRKYHRAAHNECKLKLGLNAKMVQIFVFHNLKGYIVYDGHLLMRAEQLHSVWLSLFKLVDFQRPDWVFISLVLPSSSPSQHNICINILLLQGGGRGVDGRCGSTQHVLVKDHCHITRKYHTATHNNECNLKLGLNAKMVPIFVFHNLKG